jgi:hypothetical protein
MTRSLALRFAITQALRIRAATLNLHRKDDDPDADREQHDPGQLTVWRTPGRPRSRRSTLNVRTGGPCDAIRLRHGDVCSRMEGRRGCCTGWVRRGMRRRWQPIGASFGRRLPLTVVLRWIRRGMRLRCFPAPGALATAAPSTTCRRPYPVRMAAQGTARYRGGYVARTSSRRPDRAVVTAASAVSIDQRSSTREPHDLVSID